MKRRVMGMGVLGASIGLAAFISGCGNSGRQEESVGTLNLPLTTVAASGTQYRLRDAQFQISPDYWSCTPGTGGSSPMGGTAGGGGACPPAITVSSEDDPNATSIAVTLERGYYVVQLLPGWRMEKLEGGVATDVEAQLLSPDTQWIYVIERASTWLEFSFGIGGRELWFNGDLNINVRVFEDPNELGYGGSMGGFAGSATGGSFPAAGSGGMIPGTGGTGG